MGKRGQRIRREKDDLTGGGGQVHYRTRSGMQSQRDFFRGSLACAETPVTTIAANLSSEKRLGGMAINSEDPPI